MLPRHHTVLPETKRKLALVQQLHIILLSAGISPLPEKKLHKNIKVSFSHPTKSSNERPRPGPTHRKALCCYKQPADDTKSASAPSERTQLALISVPAHTLKHRSCPMGLCGEKSNVSAPTWGCREHSHCPGDAQRMP